MNHKSEWKATPDHAAGYPDLDARLLKDWQGNVIGTARAVSSWRVRSWIGDRMYQIECEIDARTYTGRGFGSGMLWKGRAKKVRHA